MRSLLIVSSGDPAAIKTAYACVADGYIVDVAHSHGLPPPPNGAKLYVRIASLDDARSSSDLEAALAAKPLGIALSGAGGGGDLERLGARLAVQEALRGLADGEIRILAFAAETPEAVLDLPSYRGASARLDGLVCGAESLRVALGAAPGARPLRLARDMVLIAARAAGVGAFDAAFTDAADLDGLRAEALAARADGFDGKLATDPRQVAVINEVFGARNAS